MHIVHLGKYYPPAPGGIESHVKTLARGQAELGHNVSVICVNHTDKQGKDITYSRWRKTVSSSDLDGNVVVERVGRSFSLSRLEVCPNLLGKLRTVARQADVVHLHAPNPLMLIAWWLAGSRELPLVVTHHSDVIKQKFLHRFVAPIESKVYEAAKVILSDSPNYIDGSKTLQKYQQKVQVLPLGIDLNAYKKPEIEEVEATERFKKVHGHPLWLMVGRLTYYKGYHIALEALTKVDGTLIVVGNGPLEAELKRRADSLGVTKKIVWMHSVSQCTLRALYYSATALWFPSIARSEGFGLVQVEAMACGCPVINTKIHGSGVSWVSLDEITGLTVNVSCSQSLAEAANRIANDPTLAEKMGRNAVNRAVNEFNSKVMAKNSINIYKNFL